VSVYGLLNGQQQTAVPVINPGSESFSSSVQVTITDSTPGATIYYTTNGSTPTTSSTQYTGPITVTSTETINAFATAASYTPSSMASVTYTLQTQAEMSTFSPAPGTYSSPQSVSISDATPNATIYYTTDGSTPTTSSPRYTGPITVSTTTTLNAIASAPNYTQSAVASATYTIQIP
jgi:N-acetyl-beta-hexosaminidase